MNDDKKESIADFVEHSVTWMALVFKILMYQLFKWKV
jgi:hypothetical protein